MYKMRIFLKDRVVNLLTRFVVKIPIQNGFDIIFRVTYNIKEQINGIQAIEIEDTLTGESSLYLLKDGYLHFNEIILSGQLNEPVLYEYELTCITDWRYKDDDVQSEFAS